MNEEARGSGGRGAPGPKWEAAAVFLQASRDDTAPVPRYNPPAGPAAHLTPLYHQQDIRTLPGTGTLLRCPGTKAAIPEKRPGSRDRDSWSRDHGWKSRDNGSASRDQDSTSRDHGSRSRDIETWSRDQERKSRDFAS